ncbi:MAG: DUF268 domain-containing protein [Syntrophales bacterium]|nr:DUF268 domain-containing protein [Syntrophales bacterium]
MTNITHSHIYSHIADNKQKIDASKMKFRIFIKGVPLFTLLKGLPWFIRDYLLIKKQAAASNMAFPFGKFYPCLEEKNAESGSASGHYFHQDLLVAQRIFLNNPLKHVDVGSRVDGFVAHVASFRPIEVLDLRDLHASIENVHFKKVDITDRNFSLRDYCDSLSCLHVLEHLGLGRYGDRIDYNGHLIGWENLYKMLTKGGKLYFSVPIGEQRIEFNAHRVFSLKYIMGMIDGLYRIDVFSFVDDSGDLHKNVALTDELIHKNLGCHYGCGIFELTKK